MGAGRVQTFIFFLLGGLSPTPPYTVEDFSAPEAALAFAHDLLALTTYSGIEVRLGDVQIGLVER